MIGLKRATQSHQFSRMASYAYLYRPVFKACASLAQRLTRLQVQLAQVLGSAERDHHHAVPEDVLPLGHLEGVVGV